MVIRASTIASMGGNSAQAEPIVTGLPVSLRVVIMAREIRKTNMAIMIFI